MYAYKIMILRNLEIYENNRKKVNGINKFFNAYAISEIYKLVYKTEEINFNKFDYINNLVSSWRKEENPEKKHKKFVKIKKLIDVLYKDLLKFLDMDEIKSSRIDESFLDNRVDRTKVKGCSGTVVQYV